MVKEVELLVGTENPESLDDRLLRHAPFLLRDV